MDWSIPALQKLLEVAIQKLAQERGESFANAIREIIWLNLEHGRVQKYLQYNPDHTTDGYVNHVVVIFDKLEPYIRCMREGDDTIWLVLYPKLQQWVYNYLVKKKFHRGHDTQELATTYAGELACTLIQAHYPYDVEEFDAWAYQTLKNVCSKNMRHATKHRLIPDSQLDPLETPTHEENIAHLMKLPGLEGLIGERLDFEQALNKLKPKERQVIMGLLQGLTPQELAKLLGTTDANVYKIKHDAIKKLRKP